MNLIDKVTAAARAYAGPAAKPTDAQARYAICQRCIYRGLVPYERCTLCSCPLPAKTTRQQSSCPKNYW